jgi:hypothetical protein
MTEKCEICGVELVETEDTKPQYLSVVGWNYDFQTQVQVCITCFKEKPQEILDKLKEGVYE